MSKCAISLVMTIRNKYLKRSRISEAKFREILRHFSLDLSAKNIAILTNLNRNTVNRYLLILRKTIAEYFEQDSPFKGEIEVDESYLGAKTTLQAIIRGKVSLESIIHSDRWRGYNGLVDLDYKKHYRVQHGTNEFAKGNNHINGIESFWSFAKRRILKFHGIPTSTFYLHLKEFEFRFNYRDKNIYAVLLKICKKDTLF